EPSAGELGPRWGELGQRWMVGSRTLPPQPRILRALPERLHRQRLWLRLLPVPVLLPLPVSLPVLRIPLPGLVPLSSAGLVARPPLSAGSASAAGHASAAPWLVPSVPP